MPNLWSVAKILALVDILIFTDEAACCWLEPRTSEFGPVSEGVCGGVVWSSADVDEVRHGQMHGSLIVLGIVDV